MKTTITDRAAAVQPLPPALEDAPATPLCGPWRCDGAHIKALDHAEWFTIATVKCARLLPRGNEANARLIAAAPELLGALARLAEKTKRANDIQHSGGNVIAEDWSELYQLTNEARAAIAKATGH